MCICGWNACSEDPADLFFCTKDNFTINIWALPAAQAVACLCVQTETLLGNLIYAGKLMPAQPQYSTARCH